MLGGCKKSSSNENTTTPETLSFVWLAYSRGGSLAQPVNNMVMKAIIKNIDNLAIKPKFVVFGGDMSYRGYIKPNYTFHAWKDLFISLTGKGIPLYTALGNQELWREDADSGFLLKNQQEYQSVLSENPSNGPTGYEHLAYSFTSPGGAAPCSWFWMHTTSPMIPSLKTLEAILTTPRCRD